MKKEENKINFEDEEIQLDLLMNELSSYLKEGKLKKSNFGSKENIQEYLRNNDLSSLIGK